MSSPSRILELSAQISAATQRIHDTLTSQNLPLPSFEADVTLTFPSDLDAARDTLLDATSELHDLLYGFQNLLSNYGSHNNMVSLHAIHRYGIARHLPTDGPTPYAALAQSTGLEPELLKRLVRHAITHRVFKEPQKGFVEHTATSRLLAGRNADSWMGVGCEEMWPAALRTVEAMDKWPGSQEPGETGFALANDTTDTMYQVLESDPMRAKRFGEAMSLFASNKGMEPHHLVDNYDWESTVGSGLVIDLGGNKGQIAVPLAQRFPALKVLVQDLDNVVDGADEQVPDELKGRVKFMAHDFFTEQTVQAEVYLVRWCLHNWSDKYGVKLLRCLKPALRDGARVVIHDSCVPESKDMPRWRERRLRGMDLNMLSILNARERDADEWRSLFEEADPCFDFQGVKRSPGSNLSIMEAIWNEQGGVAKDP